MPSSRRCHNCHANQSPEQGEGIDQFLVEGKEERGRRKWKVGRRVGGREEQRKGESKVMRQARPLQHRI